MSSNGKNNGNGSKTKERNWSSIDPQLVNPTGQLHEKISLPGWEGIPFRGPVPDLKETDPQRKQPVMAQKVHIELLDLSDKKQLARYRTICQVVANGYGQISKEDMQYDPKKKNWRVFVRWLEIFTAMGKGAGNGRNI